MVVREIFRSANRMALMKKTKKAIADEQRPITKSLEIFVATSAAKKNDLQEIVHIMKSIININASMVASSSSLSEKNECCRCLNQLRKDNLKQCSACNMAD